jgi:hypothetical protein
LIELGMTNDDVVRVYRTFNAESDAFRAESNRREALPKPSKQGAAK